MYGENYRYKIEVMFGKILWSIHVSDCENDHNCDFTIVHVVVHRTTDANIPLKRKTTKLFKYKKHRQGDYRTKTWCTSTVDQDRSARKLLHLKNH